MERDSQSTVPSSSHLDLRTSCLSTFQSALLRLAQSPVALSVTCTSMRRHAACDTKPSKRQSSQSEGRMRLGWDGA